MSAYDRIIGHENIIAQLKNAITNNKVNHAYIFDGDDGSGKKMVAKAFAEALLCEKGGAEGCGECHFCKQTESGNNPDLIWVRHEKPGSIGVDDVRTGLVEDIQIKPYNGRYKVYIIDEAEKMTVQAQNAILKTIEEPPAYSVIIFLTNNDEIFLPTIISRCIIFKFRPLRDSVVADYLMREHKLPEYEARMCASYAQGKIGRAVSLETDDSDRLTISTSGSECNITTLDVEDYPESEEVSNESYFTIQEASLKEIINNVIFSVATDDSRPMLKGVYLEAKDFVLTAVATDGYRFAMSKKALEEKSAAISATVPSRSLAELSRLLGDSDNLLRVYVEKNYLLVALENTKLLTRLLVSGQYIRYDNIIPRDFVTTLLVNKNNFERSLATASIMSRGDKNNLVVLDIEEYNMNISSTSQYGTAKENVAVSLTGKDVRCAYNSKYLDDCLKVINAETIKMQFAQHSSCVITINNSDEVLYFILPVKQIV